MLYVSCRRLLLNRRPLFKIGRQSMTTRTYLTVDQVAARYQVSRSTAWRWTANGTIPKPVQLSPACSRWIAEELDELDAKRAEERAA